MHYVSPNQKENSKKYRLKNKDKISQKNKQKYKDENVYIYHMLKRIERRANELSLPFNLDISDLKIPKYCPILNIELKPGEGKGPSDNSPSVDRIIPELGYIKGNINIISMKANKIKSNCCWEDILKVANYMKLYNQ